VGAGAGSGVVAVSAAEEVGGGSASALDAANERKKNEASKANG
jgi:hypothetical protein